MPNSRSAQPNEVQSIRAPACHVECGNKCVSMRGLFWIFLLYVDGVRVIRADGQTHRHGPYLRRRRAWTNLNPSTVWNSHGLEVTRAI